MQVKSIPKFIKKFWPFLLSVLVFVTLRFAIHNPDLVEKYYSNGIYPFIAKLFSACSNLVPFSLWDIFWVLIILASLSGFFLVLFKKIKFSWYSLKIAGFLALGYSCFYILWGFNYFRPTVETRLELGKTTIDESAFRSILDTIIVHTNSSYLPISNSDYSVIDTEVEKMYYFNSADLGIIYPNGVRRPKKMLFSSYFAKLGVSGYFGPFFNEVHVNRYLLPMEYPFVLAHEKAHQFGITSEAEANLAAYIVCTASGDQRLRYSGYLLMLLYFLTDAQEIPEYKDFIRKIDRAVILDLRFRHRYYKVMQNETLEKMQTATNDAYLKSNHIEGGVKNYNHVVSLVISWHQNLNFRK